MRHASDRANVYALAVPLPFDITMPDSLLPFRRTYVIIFYIIQIPTERYGVLVPEGTGVFKITDRRE